MKAMQKTVLAQIDELNRMSNGQYRAWTKPELSKANEQASLKEQIIGVFLSFSVVLGVFIGVAITSQTLRGAILANIRELASLRALGVSMGSLRLIVLEISWWVGVAQSVAILPGISRSGATIATGMMMGIEPTVAAEFSFLLSIPAVLGAIVLALPDTVAAGRFGAAHLAGGVTAAIAGYWALRVVFATLRRGRFGWFGAYCLVAGGLATVWLL